jgi:hypothetical protein
MNNLIINKYSHNQKNIWNEFVKNSKNATFLFNRDYMDYHSDRFVDSSLMFYKNEELVAVLPANLKNKILYSHQGLTYGGFVSHDKMKTTLMLEIFEELVKYLQKNNIHKLIYKIIPHIYHSQPSEEDLYCLFRNNAVLFRRDVSAVIRQDNKIPFNTLRARMVKKAINNDIRVSESMDFKSYFEIIATLLENKYQAKSVHSYQEILLLANKFLENIKLFAAFKDNRMLAGVLVFIEKNIIHTQYIASSEEGQKTGALDIVMSYLINEKYQDKQYFDFGISTEQQGRYLNEGLISQKEMFGGRAVCYDQYELNIIT